MVDPIETIKKCQTKHQIKHQIEAADSNETFFRPNIRSNIKQKHQTQTEKQKSNLPDLPKYLETKFL